MDVTAILETLRGMGSHANVEGMSRFGINTATAYGISVPTLRSYARAYKNNHALALDLWATCMHEARLMATFIDHPRYLTEDQMESWVVDFDSWDICDQCCGNLFAYTPWAHEKALAWAERDETFVRRAGFVLMACLARKKHDLSNVQYAPFFKLMEQYAFDDRNFVKKAVNWALRQIGKRNEALRQQALQTAYAIRAQGTPSARWIAADAIRELEQTKLIDKLKAQVGGR